jgi:hypothetical protein
MSLSIGATLLAMLGSRSSMYQRMAASASVLVYCWVRR